MFTAHRRAPHASEVDIILGQCECFFQFCKSCSSTYGHEHTLAESICSFSVHLASWADRNQYDLYNKKTRTQVFVCTNFNDTHTHTRWVLATTLITSSIWPEPCSTFSPQNRSPTTENYQDEMRRKWSSPYRWFQASGVFIY